MFQGSSEISMDAKGRIAIPTKVRELLAHACKGHIVITASIESRCLSIYPMNVWESSVLPQVQALPSVNKIASRAKRLVIGYAENFALDANGRVQLSPSHRTWGQFEKKLTLVGLGNKYELWDSEAWLASMDDTGDEEMPDAMKTLNI